MPWAACAKAGAMGAHSPIGSVSPADLRDGHSIMSSAEMNTATTEIDATTVDALREAVSGAILALLWIHVLMVMCEGAWLIWLSSRLAKMFGIMTEKTNEAEAAKASQQQASAERLHAERKAKHDRDSARRELAANFERSVGHIVDAVAV